jgi:hypothetical protein
MMQGCWVGQRVVLFGNRGHEDFGYNVKGSQEYIGDVMGTKVKNVIYIYIYIYIYIFQIKGHWEAW